MVGPGRAGSSFPYIDSKNSFSQICGVQICGSGRAGPGVQICGVSASSLNLEGVKKSAEFQPPVSISRSPEVQKSRDSGSRSPGAQKFKSPGVQKPKSAWRVRAHLSLPRPLMCLALHVLPLTSYVSGQKVIRRDPRPLPANYEPSNSFSKSW